jgi:hypothetical protein
VSGAVLADAGIRTVLRSVRAPRMNAIAGRWTGGCRRELLDRGTANQPPYYPRRPPRVRGTPQLPRVPELIPRSRATCAIGLPASRTSRTAPSRKS